MQITPAVLFCVFCFASRGESAPLPMSSDTFVHPAAKLKALGAHKKQIWVVGYANGTIQDAIDDANTSFNNGADAVVYESSKMETFEPILKAVREKFPKKTLGVNYLGEEGDWKTTLALAKKYHMQIAWTDFSGVDLIKERAEVSLHSIEAEKPADIFYVSGIHMKYSTPVDPNKPLEKSALQAMGWVDGIVVTGKGTGQPTNPEDTHKVRAVIGNYPMGVASGVTPENVHTLAKDVDFILVNSGISNPPESRRIVASKLKALRTAMDKE